jgi:hypothetical protein
MRNTCSNVVAVGWLLFASVGIARGDGPVVRDQSDLVVESGDNLSEEVVANDFVLAGATRLTGAKVWLADDEENDNGLLDGFSGELGWAIYENNAGVPGAIVESGRAVALVQEDTGLQESVRGSDLFAVRFDLEPPLTLPAGTYWFALHEGSWALAFDGTVVWWQQASTPLGAMQASAVDETNPAAWISGSADNAFVLFAAPVAWDQAGVADGANSYEITDAVEAADFTLAVAASFSAVDVWLADDTINDDGLLTSFDGTLGWAIYDNDGGKPGNLIQRGADAAPALFDTGLQDIVDADIVRARVRFGSSISLAAGTYWLALREGAWTESANFTFLWWVVAGQNVGNASWADLDMQDPVTWDLGPDDDPAFVLIQDLIFASGVEAGVSCAWSTAAGGVCP